MDHAKLLYSQVSTFLTNIIQRIPDFSLVVLTSALLLTVGVSLGALRSEYLLLDWTAVFKMHQYHRVATSFLFFGSLSLKWVMFVVSNIKYLIIVEQGLGTRRREFYALMGCIVVLSLAATFFVKLQLCSMLFFGAVTYIWTRMNPNAQIMIMMVMPVRAEFYPFVNILIAVLSGNSILVPILAIVIGQLSWTLLSKDVLRKMMRVK